MASGSYVQFDMRKGIEGGKARIAPGRAQEKVAVTTSPGGPSIFERGSGHHKKEGDEN